MALYKQRGSKIWWFEFQFAGRRYRESAKTASKQLAGDAMRAFRRHIEESHNGITKREAPKLFPVAADEYLLAKPLSMTDSSLEIERRSIRHLLPHFRKMLLIDITPAHIKGFIDSKLAEGVSPRGVNMKLGTLRAILRRNNAWDRIRPDFKMLRAKNDCGKCLTMSEEKRLLAECKAGASRVLYPAVVLALCTGMRRDEIRLLRWRQIDLSKGLIDMGKSKTAAGEERTPRLNRSALAVMKAWSSYFPDRRPESFVFPSEKYCLEYKSGKSIVYNHDPTKPIGAWRKAFEAVRRRAGVRVRFHDLRHTAVTRMFEAKLPLPTIAKCMGWSASTAVLMALRYNHLSATEAKAAFATLELRSQVDPTKKKRPGTVKVPKRKRASSE